MEKLTIIKLGGEVLVDSTSFKFVMKEIASLTGKRVVVHGGGKIADEVAE